MLGSFPFRTVAIVALAVCLTAWAPSSAQAEVVRVNSAAYASLQGYVYCDLDKSLTLDENEGLISNVVIHCTLVEPLPGDEESGESDTSDNEITVEIGTTYTTTTNVYGFYLFKMLPPGIYTIEEEDPVEFLQGTPGTPGTVNGQQVGEASGPDSYVQVALPAGAAAEEYNFCESGLRSAYLSKRLLLTKKPIEVPEPTALVLLATGLALCLGRRRSG